MFAIREAVAAARQEEGLQDWFPMDAPATAATIRLACEDSLTRKVGLHIDIVHVTCSPVQVDCEEYCKYILALIMNATLLQFPDPTPGTFEPWNIRL